MSELSSATHNERTRLAGGTLIYWRVEGSLLELSALRQVGFFTWNAQSFAERWRRRTGMALMTILRPVAYLSGRTLATRLLYTLLRGVTRDRLDLLGEEYFEYYLKPRLRKEAVDSVRRMVSEGQPMVLVGQSLDHVIRPLAQFLGVNQFLANRMEFRDGVATGRLLLPVVRPRGPFAWIASGDPDGGIAPSALVSQLGVRDAARIEAAIQDSKRHFAVNATAVVRLESAPRVDHLSVRRALF
jgi:hypothetical protein